LEDLYEAQLHAAGSITMRKLNLASMDFDELWDLHEELSKILTEKIRAEKRRLEQRLAQLTHPEQIKKIATPLEEREADRPRRKYPKVLPKYFNPVAPMETWSGRGKQPRWFAAALRSGHKPDDLQIVEPSNASAGSARS
jgi:DNA-binding protein H-NS